MQRVLICEICREKIARFDDKEARLPIDLNVFESLYPERGVPDPFPASLGGNWEHAKCPICRRRPFLNFFYRDEGRYVVSTGDVVDEGEQWFVMVENSSGLPEKMLLYNRKQPIEHRLPPQAPEENAGQETVSEDQEPEELEPTGNYKSPPVACPTCGKQFRSSGRMAKYHAQCPNAPTSRPPQEGFKI
jgi:hypothetical protein